MFEAVGGDVLTVPVKGSAMRRQASDWRNCGTPGFTIRALLEDEDAGLRTWLMRIEPGARAAVHAHDEVEQVYLLKGAFEDGENSYEAGDYILRAPGAPHLTASDKGATMLVIYAGVERQP